MPFKKNKIDILKFISKTHREIHENRIKRELQVVITTLSFYAACVAFKLKYFTCNKYMGLIISFGFIVISFFVVYYLLKSGKSNNFNQGLSQRCEGVLLHFIKLQGKQNSLNLINELINDYDKFEEIAKKHEEDKKQRPSANRVYWQIAIILSGAAIASFLICNEIMFFAFVTMPLIGNIWLMTLLHQ